MAKQDFYDILGVAKSADAEELKRAYRKLAMEWHPDRNPGDKSAEHKFKDINEAYDVLKDEQKRAAYDRFGHAAFEGGMGGRPGGPGAGFGPEFTSSMSDIFEDLFGEFMGGGRGRGGGRGGRNSAAAHRIENSSSTISTTRAREGFGSESADDCCTICSQTHQSLLRP
jgi:molecular chaperone DnaJ